MLAVIPARGGSKGLIRKNLVQLAGKPLIQHTIEAALAASAVTRVVVTSDDAEIIEVARGVPGIEAPFVRPSELATDDAAAVDVYLHAVDWLGEHEGGTPESFCALLPTSPLRLPSDIDAAIALFRERDADVVVSVQEAKPLAWHQAMDSDRGLHPVTGVAGEAAIANRQDMGPRPVVLTGSIYVLKVEPLRRTRTYFGPKSYGYAMPASRSIDIDSEDDLRLAAALLEAEKRN